MGSTAPTPAPARTAYETPRGRLFVGRAEDVLAGPALDPWRGRVQMVFTSPPFPLAPAQEVRQPRRRRLRRLAGRLRPARSTDLLTPHRVDRHRARQRLEPRHARPSPPPGSRRCSRSRRPPGCTCARSSSASTRPGCRRRPSGWRSAGSGSRTRSPASGGCRRRPRPKADNRRVLTEYSDSMRKLLKRGTYTGGRRPSEHRIGDASFLTDNGGAIPPNVLVPPGSDAGEPQAVLPIPNTASRAAYHRDVPGATACPATRRDAGAAGRVLRAVPDGPRGRGARPVRREQHDRRGGRAAGPRVGRASRPTRTTPTPPGCGSATRRSGRRGRGATGT